MTDPTEITSDFEQKAKELFWAQSEGWTGIRWNWDLAHEVVKDRFRQHAVNGSRPWSKQDSENDIEPGEQNAGA